MRLPGLTANRPCLPQFAAGADDGRSLVWPDAIPTRRRFLRQVRAVRRGVTAVAWTLLAAAIQSVMLMLPGRAKVVFARLYWAGFCRAIGLSVRVIGAPIPKGRPVVFSANHCSWLDIPVLGGQLEACFVSKDEIARWPGVSLVARLGRTVFVSRTRGTVERERDSMRMRLAAGDNLLLFPEGTSSDGSRVLPFRTAFFSIAEGQGDEAPLIQPVSVVYDRLAGLPTGRSTRTVFAWYGDMDLATHFWQLAQWKGMRATILLHPPLDARTFASRKALSQATWNAVAGGAATLRQNRPVQPGQTSEAAAAAAPAFA
jgi:lyso-ornithine lipid O-acyltransferase